MKVIIKDNYCFGGKMKTIKKYDLTDFTYVHKKGFYSFVNKCSYFGITYAYKQFKNIGVLLEILPKIKKLGNLNINYSILPRYLVSNNSSEIEAYLTEWNANYILKEYYTKNMNEGNINLVVNILNNLKQVILTLHQNGIIHGDIHDENIFVNPNTLLVSLIDFDNCAYKKFKMNPDYCTIIVKNYINRYGVNKELDIFLINYLTFKLINNLAGYYEVNNCIINEENKYFKENDDYKNICETLLLEAKNQLINF